MFSIKLSCNAEEIKITKCLDRFGKSFPFRYTVNLDKGDVLDIEFHVRNLAARMKQS